MPTTAPGTPTTPAPSPGPRPTNPVPQGRAVLVTGGNRGIGAAVVRRLAAHGDRVVAGSRDGTAPEGAAGVSLDVTDPGSVAAGFTAAEDLLGGPVEVLVANAGISRDQLLLRLSDAELDEVLQTNLVGAIRCARQALRGMLRLRRGRIVVVSSVVASTGSAGQVAYAASKAGLIGAARSLAREVASRGITVNVVAPGFIDTDMTRALPADTAARHLDAIPLGRLGTANEVAEAVAFLAAPEAGYITGAVLPVDGGLGMGR